MVRRCRDGHIDKDIGAGLKNIVGGELESCTAMLTEARELALARMEKSAVGLGAN